MTIVMLTNTVVIGVCMAIVILTNSTIVLVTNTTIVIVVHIRPFVYFQTPFDRSNIHHGGRKPWGRGRGRRRGRVRVRVRFRVRVYG